MTDKNPEDNEGLIPVVVTVIGATIMCSIIFVLVSIKWEYISEALGITP